MKKVLSLLFVSLMTIALFAQTSNPSDTTVSKWNVDGVMGINFSQTSLTNWSGGGENSLAGNTYLNGALKYASGKWEWENNLALDYGLARTASTGVRKSTDKIDFASKMGYKANDKLFYTSLIDFKTQFTDGYNYGNGTKERISDFMAPAFGTFSIGLDYKPTKNFSLYFSPTAGKFTWVNDKEFSDKGMFGVSPGKKFKGEFGSYLKTIYKVKMMENMELISKADFFSAYDNNFGNIDVDWDMLISMKINKLLSATFNTTLRYDHDVVYIDANGINKGPKIQFRQILGVGLAYNF